MVPKKGGAENIKDFRPISLLNSLMKISGQGSIKLIEEGEAKNNLRAIAGICKGE